MSASKRIGATHRKTRKPLPSSLTVGGLLTDPERLGLLARLGAKAFAHRLGVSERTLHRRLREAGLTVRDLLVIWRRRELRHELLEDIPLSCVCERLGFASPPSLCRFVHREFADTPGRLRCRVKEEEMLGALRRPAIAAPVPRMAEEDKFGRKR